jgi:hypothetical protein
MRQFVRQWPFSCGQETQRVTTVNLSVFRRHQHRALDQRPTLAQPPLAVTRAPIGGSPLPERVGRRDQLGGLLHEYQLAA